MQNQKNTGYMTFREKMAWVMVAGLTISAGFYFYAFLNISTAMDQVPKPAIAVLTVMFIAVLTVIAIIGAIGAALSKVSEADAPNDERDDLISYKSTRWASATTGVILLLTMASYFFDARSSDMLFGIMAALIVGQLVEYVLQIYFYRRGF